MISSSDITFKTIPLLDIGNGPFRTGTSFHQNEFKDEGIPLIKIGNMKKNSICIDNCSFVDKKGENLTKQNDVLIAMRGGTTGKLSIVDEKHAGLYFVGSIGNFGSLNRKLIWPPYIKIIQEILYKHFIDGTKGTATPMVSIKMLKEIRITIPSTPEEQEIHYILIENRRSAVSKLVNEISSQQSLLKQLRQAILQEAVEGKLTAEWRKQNPELISGENHAARLLEKIKEEKERLVKEGKIKKQKPLPPISEDEKPFDLPEGWVWCRLGEIIQISSGDGLTSKEMSKDGEIPVYGGNGINGYHSKANTFKPTIVIGRVGAHCGAIHLTGRQAWITDNAFKTHFPENSINIFWLYKMLVAISLRKLARETAQPVLSGKRIYPFIFPFPPLAEQQAIVEKVDRLMAKINALEEQVKSRKEQAGQLMQAVLREAFNGGN